MPYPLLTPRLKIEPLSSADLVEFVRYRQDPDVAKYQSWETTYSESDAKNLLESQDGITMPTQGEWLQLAIRHSESSTLLGDLAIHRPSDSEGSFEIGFTLASENQGHGFAREAVSRLIDELFNEQDAHLVFACTDDRNTASKNLLENLGFKRVPSKDWSEFFKGENVTVEHYELAQPKGVTALGD